jgi:hypothetical protein
MFQLICDDILVFIEYKMKDMSITKIRNIEFCALGSLVWKWVGLQYPTLIFSEKDHSVEYSEVSVN